MLSVIRRTTTILLLTGAALVASGPAMASQAMIESYMEDSAAMQCANKAEKWFTFITIASNELALDRIKLVQRPQIFVIPLKTQHGEITAIRWHPKDTSEGMDFVRYLQSGKIGAVNVLPFLHHPADVYVANRELREKLKDCQKEQLLESFGKCTECEVMEWLSLKP